VLGDDPVEDLHGPAVGGGALGETVRVVDGAGEFRAVVAGRFRQSHRGRAHVGELPPQLLVVTQRLGGAYALCRALLGEEFSEGVAHGFLVAAQGVVGVA
jgi:hypothetical protein